MIFFSPLDTFNIGWNQIITPTCNIIFLRIIEKRIVITMVQKHNYV